jgi:hypothetical protein
MYGTEILHPDGFLKNTEIHTFFLSCMPVNLHIYTLYVCVNVYTVLEVE